MIRQIWIERTMGAWRRLRRSVAPLCAITVLTVGVSGCAIDRLLDASESVEGAELDPSMVANREGAIRVHRSVMTSMAAAFADVSYHSAMFTDELSTTTNGPVNVDARSAREGEGVQSSAYEKLHNTRVRASQVVTLLRRFGSAQDSALVGEAYALEAQSIVFLGELFCSGIPLTRVPFDGGLQYTAGMTTTQLFETAVALFDTAYMFGKDSAAIATLAKIGKGRALMNLQRYAEARIAVQDVETSALYTIRYAAGTGGVTFWPSATVNGLVDVANDEGGSGLDWAAVPPAVQDPRVPLSSVSPRRQQKFPNVTPTVALMKGAEARMIEAEALLQPADAPAGDWLAPLNAARATLSLDALTDPGTAEGRIDLLFRERAFWFFLEGHRLGDYRRLVRQYNRLPTTVYATGPYVRATWYIAAYGTEYVFVPPAAEEDRNPLYRGCFDRRP